MGSSRCYGTQLCDEAGNEDFAVSEADMKCHLQLDPRGKNGAYKRRVGVDTAGRRTQPAPPS